MNVQGIAYCYAHTFVRTQQYMCTRMLCSFIEPSSSTAATSLQRPCVLAFYQAADKTDCRAATCKLNSSNSSSSSMLTYESAALNMTVTTPCRAQANTQMLDTAKLYDLAWQLQVVAEAESRCPVSAAGCPRFPPDHPQRPGLRGGAAAARARDWRCCCLFQPPV